MQLEVSAENKDVTIDVCAEPEKAPPQKAIVLRKEVRDERRCTARAKLSGNRCRRPAIVGGTVCTLHGGSAPQVRAAAIRRLGGLVPKAIDRIGALIDVADSDNVRLAAAKDALDRNGLSARTAIDVEISVKRYLGVPVDEV